VVGAGLLVGDRHARGAMSDTTQRYVESFWTLVDELLNALLFFMLGLQLLVLPLEARLAGLSVAAVALVLLLRFVVVLPWGSYLHLRHEERGASVILAWGGLHGALSLALALSVPAGPQRTVILALTYAVATVSVAFQGLSFGPVAAWMRRRGAAPDGERA
jgi:CPA1 family monovalent cation:H+ antiporter